MALKEIAFLGNMIAIHAVRCVLEHLNFPGSSNSSPKWQSYFQQVLTAAGGSGESTAGVLMSGKKPVW